MKKLLKKNRKPPTCPGCNDATYVSFHSDTQTSIKDPWCGRCNHWFKVVK